MDIGAIPCTFVVARISFISWHGLLCFENATLDTTASMKIARLFTFAAVCPFKSVLVYRFAACKGNCELKDTSQGLALNQHDSIHQV